MAAAEAVSAADAALDGLADGLGTVGLGRTGSSERGAALDQATFFRAVENCNIPAITGLLKAGNVDINALNQDGVTALLLAVCEYEKRRNMALGLITTLLENGADPTATMAASADRRICIVKHQQQQQAGAGGQAVVGSPGSGSVMAYVMGQGSQGGAVSTSVVGLGNSGSSLVSELHSTKKIPVAGKTPLLVALELKSALYLKGWDYRHWDKILNSLAFASVGKLEGEEQGEQTAAEAAGARSMALAAGWAAVFESGRHETLEVWAEGKHLEVLKLLLVTNSKVLKNMVEAAELQRIKGRVELKDASFNIVRELLAFLYSGHVDPAFVRMRGVDLLLAAHKYQVSPLKDAIVQALEANPDNWMRLVSVALEVGSPALMLKCAKSIISTMEDRSSWRGPSSRHAFSSTMTPPVGNPELKDEQESHGEPGAHDVWRHAESGLDHVNNKV